MAVTKQTSLPEVVRADRAILLDKGTDVVPSGFGLYIFRDRIPSALDRAAVAIPESLGYLDEGDVIKVDLGTKRLRALFRRSSRHNFFLLTERCNHRCLMCSQPPKDVQDDWLAEDMLAAIPLIDRRTAFLGITGGEPTLLGDRFFAILQKLTAYLPDTAVQVLSNGRAFADDTFTRRLVAVRHKNLRIAIPLYADVSTIHDYVVQADGAFDETIRGILALKRRGQQVEVRVVIHKATYERLPQLAEFIYRNLAFVDHVALMGLEITGFAKANLKDLWIDPTDYRRELSAAVKLLAARRMNFSVFNHQLCTIDEVCWPYAKKSISDWKNEYVEACDKCEVKGECGGFFTTSTLRRSEAIRPVRLNGSPI